MNFDQKRLDILAATGNLLIEGGPGCGKTTIALYKAYQTLANLGPEQRVLFLSFSRAAVRQITDRMRGIFDYTNRHQLEVRTFHAFFLDLVRSHSPQLTGQAARIVTPEEESRLKFDHDGSWDDEVERLAAEGTFVFDKLAPTTAAMLEASSALRALYSSTYPLVIVDEFQDTNVDQWHAVRALALGSQLICLADPDQRIFEGFVKGVDPHRLDELRDELSPTPFDLGGDNHRSPASGLLSYANAVLRADANTARPPTLTQLNYKYATQTSLAGELATSRLQRELEESLGSVPTIAVLATENALLMQLSDQFGRVGQTPGGESFGPVEHDFHFEPQKAAAAGYVVASILEWPTLSRSAGISGTLDAIIDFHRTGGGTTARKSADVLRRGHQAFLADRAVRSKNVQIIIAAHDAGIELVGDPVTDWQTARAVLRGSPDFATMFERVRQLRLLQATDDLAWGLLGLWDGGDGYAGAVGEVRRILADRVLDDSRSAPASVSLMNMHRSKGKEFDGVVIVEGQYSGLLFSRAEDFPARSARRRLLRVGLSRARHRIVLVRPTGSLSLMTTKPAG